MKSLAEVIRCDCAECFKRRHREIFKKERRFTAEVPNRLFGVEINSEGDAV